jgi:uncharacterized repeat protein (TIGR03803 family)
VVLDTEDNLDGTTFGGVNTTGSTAGTVFKLTPSGSFTTLVSFSGFNEIYPDAAYPLARYPRLFPRGGRGPRYGG